MAVSFATLRPTRSKEEEYQRKATVQNWVQHYNELLAYNNLTPLLRQQITGTRDFFEASLTSRLGVLGDTADGLHPMQIQVQKHWQALYSKPNTVAAMISDIWALRKLLFLRLRMDYDPEYKDKIHSYTPEYRIGTYGRYLEDPGEWGSAELGYCRHDNELHYAAYERTKEVAKEAMIDMPYAAHQLCMFFDSQGIYECLTWKLARRGEWRKLAQKILEDENNVVDIYPQSCYTSDMVAHIAALKQRFFSKLISPGNFELSAKAKKTDKQRLADQNSPLHIQKSLKANVKKVLSKIKRACQPSDQGAPGYNLLDS
ncbi:hypothetical protein MMC24_001096 [Lignoscripta atroalba]|nr:hypothetical protein [Lignoscripta atroalba]